MSNDTQGAVDNDFDDAKRDAEARLTERIDAFPREIKGGDVAIDLVEGRPLYVRRRKGTAIDVFERGDFDLVTYKAHPWLPVRVDDPVYECVFLPTKPSDIPGKKKTQTYDYPRGRLARVPVEWLYGSDMRPQDDQIRALLAALFDVAPDADYQQAVVDVAVDTFGTDTVDDALDRAGYDPSSWGADEEDRSQAAARRGEVEAAIDGEELGDFDGGSE